MGRGSSSFSHQHVYAEGKLSLGRLQPGHRHCLGGGRSAFSGCREVSVEPSFSDHFFMQPRWNTVQHVLHDQTLEFRVISAVQIGHS